VKRNPFERDLPPGAAQSEPLSLLEPLPPITTTHTATSAAPGMAAATDHPAPPPMPPLEVTHATPPGLDPLAVQHSGPDSVQPLTNPISLAGTASNLPSIAPSGAAQYDPLPSIAVVQNAKINHLEPIAAAHSLPEGLPAVQHSEFSTQEALPSVEVAHQAPELLAPLAAAPAAVPPAPPEVDVRHSAPEPLSPVTVQTSTPGVFSPIEHPPHTEPPAMQPLQVTQSKQDEVDVEALLSAVQPREEKSFFRLSGVPLLSEM
jgi:hypothetical protein